MRQLDAICVLAVLLLGLACSQADLLDCEDKLADVVATIEEKTSFVTGTGRSSDQEVRSFFKNVGCQIKNGAKKLGEKAKDLGAEIKEGAKKLGSDISDRIADFRGKLAKDSAEDMNKDHVFLANVEIINPDLLKGEQQCGHGHILDALGNCSKLRK